MNVESVALGENVNMFCPLHDLTPKQEKAWNVLIDEAYDGFLEKVAVGRKMPIEQVRWG